MTKEELYKLVKDYNVQLDVDIQGNGQYLIYTGVYLQRDGSIKNEPDSNWDGYVEK